MLPRHMIPTVYCFMESLPRTPTGKINRPALPVPASLRPPLRTPFAPPRTETERELAAIWREVLHLDQIGRNDNFFDLGGDSLMMLNLVMRMEEKFQKQTPSDFFRNPAIAPLASFWEGKPYPGKAEEVPSPGKAAPAPAGGRRAVLHPVRNRKKHSAESLSLSHRLKNVGWFFTRNAIIALAAQLPYAAGSGLVDWFCHQPAFTNAVFKEQTLSFRRFLDELGGCPDAPPDALAIHLTGNILWGAFFQKLINPLTGRFFIENLRNSRSIYWRSLAGIIDRSSPEELDRFFPVRGLEHIQRAYQQKRGVIIVAYHNTANRLAMAALPRRLGCPPIPTISRRRALHMEAMDLKEGASEYAAPEELSLMADLTVQGQRALMNGEIIQIVPDGSRDIVGDRPFSVGGRTFRFKPGFAEMALNSNSVIIPQYTTRRPGGVVATFFSPPFSTGSENEDRAARVYGLLAQYAGFLDRSWRLAPESLRWDLVDRFGRRPPAGSGA
jgi:acyl carrier protein/lauroyl/myristoyl acyltransferase